MRSLVLLVAAMLGPTLLMAGAASTQPAAQGAAGRYIVVLDDGVSNPSRVASEIEQRQDNLDVGYVYDSALEGFSAEIPDEDLAEVRSDPRVDNVARDARVHPVTVQTIPWGIDKIGAGLSFAESGDGKGAVSNVNVYIIDTGVYKKHPDLNVVSPSDPNNVPNFAGGRYTDCGEGHGTHVAGIVAAKDNDRGVVGVVPGAPVTSVKVLGCTGGFISNVIAGIDWVTEDVKGPDHEAGTADDKTPAIANLSLTTRASEAPDAAADLDEAVKSSVASGVFYSVAAGNDADDACEYSPARAGLADSDTNGDGQIDYRDNNGIVTTAAVDLSGQVPNSSNYGRCVDLWAPGKDILSTKNEGGTSMMSGTSMAAPHVGGTAALYLSFYNTGTTPPPTPSIIERTLKKEAEDLGPLRDRKNSRDIKRVYAGACNITTGCPIYQF